MKLDPVYLLAPKPKPPSIPTRRAFLIAGSTFLAGAGLGSACGYAVGSRPAEAAVDAKEDWLKPTGDADLDELRRLAVKAPIDEMLRDSKWLVYTDLLRDTYPHDEALWHGAERLANSLLNNPSIQDRRKIAKWLAQVIERSKSRMSLRLRETAEELKRIR